LLHYGCRQQRIALGFSTHEAVDFEQAVREYRARKRRSNRGASAVREALGEKREWDGKARRWPQTSVTRIGIHRFIGDWRIARNYEVMAPNARD